MKVTLQAVSKRYGRVRALKPTSLELDSGQIIAVLGPNGAGKTTLLRCLATLVAPGGGRILWDGEQLTRDRLDIRRRFMFMPDFPPLYADLTVLQHLSLILQVYESQMEAREAEVIEVLRDLDLLALCDTRVRHLSRGQGYKTALAALVLVNPDLWLIDEPFASGMDPNGISYFKKRARQAARQDKLVIYSTQILDIAEAFSDRVCVIHKGDVRAFDSVEALSRSNSKDSAEGILEQVLQKLREEDQ